MLPRNFSRRPISKNASTCPGTDAAFLSWNSTSPYVLASLGFTKICETAKTFSAFWKQSSSISDSTISLHEKRKAPDCLVPWFPNSGFMLAVSLSTLASACCRRYIKSPARTRPISPAWAQCPDEHLSVSVFNLPEHSTAFTCRHTKPSLAYIIHENGSGSNICLTILFFWRSHSIRDTRMFNPQSVHGQPHISASLFHTFLEQNHWLLKVYRAFPAPSKASIRDINILACINNKKCSIKSMAQLPLGRVDYHLINTP